MTAPLSQAVKDARLIERLQLDNTRLRGLNRTLSRNQGMAFEQVVDQFKEFLDSDESFEKFVITPTHYPKHKSLTKSVFDKDHTEIAALVFSDPHLSETIRFEDTNGINKYGSVITANRMFRIFDAFKRILRGHQTMYAIDKIWLLLLGDMISGSIHEELILTNDLLDIPAAVLMARLLIMAIHELKTLGLPIEIDATVGNHARTLVKMPAKRQAQLSFDWMIYVMVQQAFQNDRQVKIRVHTGQFGMVQQYGHRVVFEHGYGAKNGDEVNVEKRIRAMFDSPIYRKATGLKGTSLDYVILADKHQFKFGERWMVNGCLSGSNEYGMANRFEPIGALQGMFGISRKRIPSWVYPLDATSIVSDSVDNSFSECAKAFMKEHGR